MRFVTCPGHTARRLGAAAAACLILGAVGCDVSQPTSPDDPCVWVVDHWMCQPGTSTPPDSSGMAGATASTSRSIPSARLGGGGRALLSSKPARTRSGPFGN